MNAPPARIGRRPVSAVVFDYGHTLVTFELPHEPLARAHLEIRRRLVAAGLTDVPPAEVLLTRVHDRLEEEVARHEAGGDLRELDMVEMERAAYLDLGLDLPDGLLGEMSALVQRAWWEGVRVCPSAPPVLEELRRRGLRLGLCSNAPYRPVSMRAQLEHLGLAPFFAGVAFSSEVGWCKPSSQVFAACVDALGVPAERCAMVGDRLWEDVAGARAAGMAAIRTRELRDDGACSATRSRNPCAEPDEADAVIDRLTDLVPILFGTATRGTAVVASVASTTSRRSS